MLLDFLVFHDRGIGTQHPHHVIAGYGDLPHRTVTTVAGRCVSMAVDARCLVVYCYRNDGWCLSRLWCACPHESCHGVHRHELFIMGVLQLCGNRGMLCGKEEEQSIGRS